MSHIFISYSRRDLNFAQEIVDALGERGLETWIDWKSIPKGEDWEQEIYRGIEGAEAFLFLISPDSVQSPMCNKEVLHAIQNNKRILPILIRDSKTEEFLDEGVRGEIKRLNWIFCRRGVDDFTGAIKSIQTTIRTDYDWVRFHTDLQVKALAWEKAKREDSRLLRGRQLKETVDVLGNATTRIEPPLTELQQQFVHKSRQAVRQRKTLPFKALLALAIIVFVWGKFYFLVLPVSSACPQVTMVSIILEAPDLTDVIRERLETGPQTTARKKCEGGMEGDIRGMANYMPETGEIYLAIQLPDTPAYRMDFLQEIRSFGPEIVSEQEFNALLQAASAYSLGEYSSVVEILEGHDSLAANVLTAQSQLFTDDLEASRASYERALEMPRADDEFTGKLRMGAALAWWRPASYHYFSGEEKSEACNRAGDYYVQAQDWVGTNTLARNITNIFALYCTDDGDENLAKYAAWKQGEPLFNDDPIASEAGLTNAAAHFILAYLLGPDERETRDEYKGHLTSARELMLARALLSEFLWEVELKCVEARDMREQFKAGIFSRVEMRKLQSLLQSQPLTCR